MADGAAPSQDHQAFTISPLVANQGDRLLVVFQLAGEGDVGRAQRLLHQVLVPGPPRPVGQPVSGDEMRPVVQQHLGRAGESVGVFHALGQRIHRWWAKLRLVEYPVGVRRIGWRQIAVVVITVDTHRPAQRPPVIHRVPHILCQNVALEHQHVSRAELLLHLRVLPLCRRGQVVQFGRVRRAPGFVLGIERVSRGQAAPLAAIPLGRTIGIQVHDVKASHR